MERKLYSVKGVAERISRHLECPDEPVQRLLRALIASKAIMPTTIGGSGPTAPALFNEADLTRAALLVALDRLGLSHDSLALVAKRMNNCEGLNDDGLGESPAGRPERLDKILAEVNGGDSWYLHVFFVPEFYGKSSNVLGAKFSSRSDAGAPHPYAIAITIPLSAYVPPFATDEAVGG